MKIQKMEKILKLVNNQEMLTVTALQEQLKIPRTTLLRYLSELEKNGEIIKTFGEVRKRKSQIQSSANNRKNSHTNEKEAIAKIVKDIVKDGDAIFLDGGTTNRMIAMHLKDKDIEIYTNNLLIVDFINIDYKPRVILVPGAIKKDTLCTASIETYEYISTINFDKVFLGFNSMVNSELATTNIEESLIKKVAIKNAGPNKTWVVGGSHKINKEKSKYIFGDKNDVTIITEKGGEI